ncbi:universal stress protein [Mesorhizobium sp. 131-2-1]|uniref:universal stress protein n=1 Tax=Mesorhizobium sp. 131-2-1 TaxID=2744518 RepID=UPI001928F330|nr:universal stress protein [Mesorhizobium sp. 131-2-1]BCG92202.1 universal stress protein [Mesorhizobium sp. 131-2-1]
MYHHILIPIDGSEKSKNTVAHGVSLAAALNAKVTILTVEAPLHSIASDPTPVVEIPGAAEFVHELLHGKPEEYLASAAAVAAASQVSFETVHIEHEHRFAAIIETAEARGCDLIVMASHRRSGISAVLLGSVTLKVLTHSNIPVLVHRS